MEIGDLRRKLGLGLRSLHASTVLAIEHETLARPALAWDKAAPVSLLWSCLLVGLDGEAPPSSSFLPAAAGQALGRLLTKGALDWQKSLNHILHRLEAVPPVCLPYVVQLLFHLIDLHVQSQQPATYKCPYVQKSHRRHPLVTLVIARPDAWCEVFYGVRNLLARQKGLFRVTAVNFLDPFFTYICLEAAVGPGGAVGQHLGMHLHLLSEASKRNHDESSRADYTRALSRMLLALLRTLPVVSEEPDLVQIMLSEFLVNLAARSKDGHVQCQSVCHLLNWAFDSWHSDRSLLPALKALQTFVDTAGVGSFDEELASYVLAALAFLLLEIAEYEHQGAAVISLMLEILRSVNIEHETMKMVARTAMLPILQALSETSDGPVKRKLFDILLILERAVLWRAVAHNKRTKKPEVFNNATGTFAVLVHDIWSMVCSTSPIDSALTACSHRYRPLLLSGMVFHARSAMRVRALAELTSLPHSTPALHMSFLPTLLYVLKTDPAPVVQVQVLLHSLPALTRVNEAFVTAKVVGVMQSLLGDLSGASSGTLADACLYKPQDCGQDLLPHLIALLQTPALHVATAIAALQAVNACVQADITDPRAMWNVFMMQYVLRTEQDAHVDILACLCDFYRLVAVKDDSSDLYAAFKSEVIATHLFPLQSHAEPIVAEAALLALAAFPAPDLFSVFPVPRDLVARCGSLTQPSVAAPALLATFITHECVTMRRAVFKGFAAAQGARVGGTETSESTKSVARLTQDVKMEIRASWDGGKAPAGLRSGLAAFALLTTPNGVEAAEMQSSEFSQLPFRRTLINATRDLSLSDHPKFRTQAIPVWTRFWDTTLLAAYKGVHEPSMPQTDVDKLKRVQQVENLVVGGVTDLLCKRLAEAHLPSLTVNVVLSTAGLVLAASNLGLTVAPEQAARVIDTLVDEHALRPEQNPDTYTDNQRSDDVQFAVALALASLTKALHANDNARFNLVAKTLDSGLVQANLNGHEWYQFACAYGLTTLSAPANAIVTAPYVASLCANHASSSARRGFFAGLAASLPLLNDSADTVISEMVEDAVRTVKEFATGAGTRDNAAVESASVLVSGAIAAQWLVSDKAEDAEDALRKSVQIVAGKRNEEALYAEVLCAYAQASYHVAPTSSALLQQLTELPRSAAPSTRIAAYLALPALFGLTPSSFHHNRKPDPPLLRRVSDLLRTVVVGPEPKVARVAGWVLGSILADCEQDDGGRNDMMSAAGEAVAGTKDPADYVRLNSESSYLRAVFDALAGTISCNLTTNGRNVLFQAFTQVNVPLPPVDWSRIDALPKNRNGMSPDPVFTIAAKHASPTSAKSLVAIFVAGIQRLIDQKSPLLADRTLGIPRLLHLGGLVPDDEALEPEKPAEPLSAASHVPVAVAGSKLIQLFAAAVSTVFNAKDRKICREFALGVVPYLTSDTAFPTLRTNLLRELLTTYASLPETPVTHDEVVAIRALSTCFASDLDALSSLPLPKTQQLSELPSAKEIWVVGRLAELAHLHPWVPHRLVHVAPGGPNAALAHVVRSALAVHKTRQHAFSALLTAVQNTMPDGRGPLPARALLQWVLLLLDIAIVLCARGQAAGEAVEAAWQAIGAVVSMERQESEFGESERVIQHHTGTNEGHSVFFADLIAQVDISEATRKQIFKRLVRLLECTVAHPVQPGQDAPTDARVRIPAACREAMREVLLRARGFLEDSAEYGVGSSVIWEASC
ncbi:hypothetical protein HDU86_001135 [Geranomyces michiganensis]|nr:hypothetical protein HDU86_001135 [Geranomyces michiganensis]